MGGTSAKCMQKKSRDCMSLHRKQVLRSSAGRLCRYASAGGTDALNGFGEIYMAQAMASGVIPQITAVFGTCGGGMALIPAMTDFTFMESKNGKLFVNSPNATGRKPRIQM